MEREKCLGMAKLHLHVKQIGLPSINVYQTLYTKKCTLENCYTNKFIKTTIVTPFNPLNPLSPNIHIQILQTDLYTFP